MTHRIAVIPGDGTGPEVVAEGLKVLNAIAGPAHNPSATQTAPRRPICFIRCPPSLYWTCRRNCYTAACSLTFP